ncbi:SUKH-4 family immunity protein [Streptomyces sp. YIM S03343]
MTQSFVGHVFAGPHVEEWLLPEDAKQALQTVGVPKMAASWKAARIQRGKAPILHFEGIEPLYEIVRKVSLWNPDRAYCCFGAESHTGRVFRAHPKVPSDEVDSQTAFGVPRLVNTSVLSFLRALDLEAAQYIDLFGAPSAKQRAEMHAPVEPDDDILWSVSERYLWKMRDLDPVAWDDPEGYWRNLYRETWEETGYPPFRFGSNPFEAD